MSCDRFIYKVSWFNSKKHVNSWRDEYYMEEEQTRFIYDAKEYGDVRISVMKVCVNSEIYKNAKRPQVEKEEVETFEKSFDKIEEEVVPTAPPSTPEKNINFVIDDDKDLWLRDANGRRVRDKESDWDKYR